MKPLYTWLAALLALLLLIWFVSCDSPAEPDVEAATGIEVRGADDWPEGVRSELSAAAASVSAVVSDHSAVLDVRAETLPHNVLGYSYHDEFSTDGLIRHMHMVIDTAQVSEDGMRFHSGELASTVFRHEITHGLGIGTSRAWHENDRGHCYYGENAVSAFQAAGGEGDCVPLDKSGHRGTDNVHWHGCLGDELMIGVVNATHHFAFSAITAGALRDMGYEIDESRVEPYEYPGGCPREEG